MARITLKAALVRVARVWQQQAAAGQLSIETVALYIQITERLLRFAAAHGVLRLDDISGALAQGFIEAPGHDRHRGVIPVPAGSTRRQRRSALESLFTEARALGLTRKAPLVDLPPIPRDPRRQGTQLAHAEIELLKFHAERGMPATRHAALLALLLSGLHNAEIAAATTSDLDLSGPAVHTSGATYTCARTCPLDTWAVRVLDLRRTHLLRSTGPEEPHRLVTTASSARRSQASVCTGFGDIARRAGLTTARRRVEPKDATRYTARRILNETGQLSEVARRLGLSSLDSAAAWAGLRWHPGDEGGTAA